MQQLRLRHVAAAATAVATMVLVPSSFAHHAVTTARLPASASKAKLPVPRHSAVPGRGRLRHAPRRGPVASASHLVAGVPYHRLGTQYCRYGQISVNVPEQVVSSIAGNQYVWFQTDVYRLTSSGWSYVTSTPFFRAVASPSGLLSGGGYADNWAVYESGRFVQRFPGAYTMNLSAGTYMTLQSIWWNPTSNPHVEAPAFIMNSYLGSASRTCTMN